MAQKKNFETERSFEGYSFLRETRLFKIRTGKEKGFTRTYEVGEREGKHNRS